MALSTYSLLSMEELKESLQISGTGKDFVVEQILNRVTDEIEDHLDRQIVTRTTALTEYHSVPDSFTDLKTLEWPIITVTSVHEDIAVPRTYGASTLLVDGTHFEVVKAEGRRSIIRRIALAGFPYYWLTGHRVIRIVYTAGYPNTAAVPPRIRAVAFRYAALLWDEHKRGAYGVSGQSDGMGNYTRFASPHLTDDMKGALVNDRRSAFWESGERAA